MQPEMQHTNSDLSISVLYPAISSFVFQGSQETCRGAVICRVAGIRAIHLMLLLWNRSFFLVITSCCPWFLSQLPWPATLAISYRIIFFYLPWLLFSVLNPGTWNNSCWQPFLCHFYLPISLYSLSQWREPRQGRARCGPPGAAKPPLGQQG